MKWKSCDNNVIEKASISKFSKLDDKGTPLRLLEFLLDDASRSSHREKADIGFGVTNEKIHLFLSMVIWCQKFPDRKTYWKTTHDTFV